MKFYGINGHNPAIIRLDFEKVEVTRVRGGNRFFCK